MERVGTGHCREGCLAAGAASRGRGRSVETPLGRKRQVGGQVTGGHSSCERRCPLEVDGGVPVVRVIVRALSWWRKTWSYKICSWSFKYNKTEICFLKWRYFGKWRNNGKKLRHSKKHRITIQMCKFSISSVFSNAQRTNYLFETG